MDEQETEYAYVDDVRYELGDDDKIIEETATPYCEACHHYHTDETGCLCPECGQREPCGVAHA